MADERRRGVQNRSYIDCGNRSDHPRKVEEPVWLVDQLRNGVGVQRSDVLCHCGKQRVPPGLR